MPDTGSLRGDLIETTRSIRDLFTDTSTAPIATAVLAASPRRPSLAAADPRLVMDMLAGAIRFRLFLRAEPVEAADIDAAVDMVLGGVAP